MGAEGLLRNLAKITGLARKTRIPIFSSVDAHAYHDAEFKIFPRHCVKNSSGAGKLRQTLLARHFTIQNKKYNIASLRRKIEKYPQVIFEKDTYTVFANPNLKPLLKDVSVAYVYGVALDYCVKACCMGLREMGINTYLVADATAAVDKKQGRATLKLLRQKGVKFIPTQSLIEKFGI